MYRMRWRGTSRAPLLLLLLLRSRSRASGRRSDESRLLRLHQNVAHLSVILPRRTLRDCEFGRWWQLLLQWSNGERIHFQSFSNRRRRTGRDGGGAKSDAGRRHQPLLLRRRRRHQMLLNLLDTALLLQLHQLLVLQGRLLLKHYGSACCRHHRRQWSLVANSQRRQVRERLLLMLQRELRQGLLLNGRSGRKRPQKRLLLNNGTYGRSGH